MKMTEESYGNHTILHNVKASYQVITMHASLDWYRSYEDEGVKWMILRTKYDNNSKSTSLFDDDANAE